MLTPRAESPASDDDAATRRVRIPPHRLYWATIDAPAPSRIDSHHGDMLLLLAAEDLPIDPGELHAAGTRLDERRILICAAERAMLTSLSPSTLSATPASLPPFLQLDDPAAIASRLELLTGDLQPRAAVEARRWAQTQIALAVAIVAATCGLALDAASRIDKGRAAETVDSVWTALARRGYRTADGSTTLASADPRLEHAVAAVRLERARSLLHRRLSDQLARDDAALQLQRALRAWPQTLQSRQGGWVSNLAILPDSVAFTATVPADVTPTSKALDSAGWQTRSLRTSKAADGVLIQFSGLPPRQPPPAASIAAGVVLPGATPAEASTPTPLRHTASIDDAAPPPPRSVIAGPTRRTVQRTP